MFDVDGDEILLTPNKTIAAHDLIKFHVSISIVIILRHYIRDITDLCILHAYKRTGNKNYTWKDTEKKFNPSILFNNENPVTINPNYQVYFSESLLLYLLSSSS